MSDVTQILFQIQQGDQNAADQLLPLVYEELRKLATSKLDREAPGQTLQATALVHEAYLRLVDVNGVQHWNSRGHFFGAAAEAMRRILLDRARNKKRLKPGGGRKRLNIDSIEVALDTASDELLVIDREDQSKHRENWDGDRTNSRTLCHASTQHLARTTAECTCLHPPSA